jgi:hypothetical protein
MEQLALRITETRQRLAEARQTLEASIAPSDVEELTQSWAALARTLADSGDPDTRRRWVAAHIHSVRRQEDGAYAVSFFLPRECSRIGPDWHPRQWLGELAITMTPYARIG